MKLILVVIFNILFVGKGKSADDITITLGKEYVLIGLEYVTPEFVPSPFVGVWKQFYYSPASEIDKKHNGSVVRFSFTQGKKMDYSITQSIVKDGVTSLTISDKDFQDWTFGLYDKSERENIVKGKHLLDYDKALNPLPLGLIPDSLKISKVLIANYKENLIYMVTYSSLDLNLIKKYHRIPIFMSWGKADNFWYN